MPRRRHGIYVAEGNDVGIGEAETMFVCVLEARVTMICRYSRRNVRLNHVNMNGSWKNSVVHVMRNSRL